MAEAIVSVVLQQLTDTARKEIQEEVSLVRGVKKQVHNLSSQLKTIRNVLDDAERRGSYKEKSIQRWLVQLEDTTYNIADVLDEWNLAILKHQSGCRKVCPFIQSCLCFKKVAVHHDIAVKIKGLKERMDMIVKEKDSYNFLLSQPGETRMSYRVTSSSVDESVTHGREADKDDLVNKLILEDSSHEKPGIPIIAVKGSGGIEKTTLAQLVYKDDRVAKCFEKMIWVCVSNVSDEVKIVIEIVEQVKGSSPNVNGLEALLKCVENCISKKKYLLVLDDVWEEYCDKWEPLKNTLRCGAQGSKILMTTRSERVARLMGAEIQELGLLSDDDCWLLMSRIAYSGRREEDRVKFQDIGRNITKKCKGLPLAAKVLGSHLCFKYTMEEWESVLDSELWKLEEVEVELFPHLLLSYNELSPAMKRCFSYCAIYPKDSEINVEKLIRMWIALGYLGSRENTDDLERRGREYFDNLKMRSLFQDHEKPFDRYQRDSFCRMHDIIHDFAIFVRKNKSRDLEYSDNRTEAVSKMSFQDSDELSWPISEIKVYHSLVFEGQLPLHQFDCVAGLRILSLCDCRLEELPTDIENLIHLRYLDLSRNRWLWQIPQTICKLYYLETLYLADCGLEEIPEKIGNLVNLRHLDLSYNSNLCKLPKNICNLHELQTLNLTRVYNLKGFPEGMHRLKNLRHILNDGTTSLKSFPEGLRHLTSLRSLRQFYAGGKWSKLEYLNKLDQLSEDLLLIITIEGVEDVVGAQIAELRNKIGIRRLYLDFWYDMRRTSDDDGDKEEGSINNGVTQAPDRTADHDEEESVKNDVMKALEPPPNLQHLSIHSFEGTKFPGWMITSLDHLKVLRMTHCKNCSALPPLGKLPCLEELRVEWLKNLQYVGREFLGIMETTPSPASSSSSSSSPLAAGHDHHELIGFPKLKKLTFDGCYSWREWDDITTEDEEDIVNMSIMPCLEKLEIRICDLIKVLPHRLLRKASSLQHLVIVGCSKNLWEVYGDEEGLARRSLSHIPNVDIRQ